MPKYSTPNYSLYVRNLPDSTRADDLRGIFTKYGPVRDVYIPSDYFTGRIRGFAYVEFEDIRDAEDAVYHLGRGVRLHGRVIDVEFAVGDRKTPGQMHGKYGSPYRSRRSNTPRNRKSRSRSRSRRRHRSRSKHRSRSRSDSRHRDHGGHRSKKSRSRSRSRHGSKSGHKRRRSRSRSRTRSKSGSRSRSASAVANGEGTPVDENAAEGAESVHDRENSNPPIDENSRSPRVNSNSPFEQHHDDN